ncbi:permease-like cell division protein FtsX [uncultured Alistipes sp.]|jgi:cell division transport system permease protein|uniref:cell division protein FtsX n=1 Tax=uncultured Alistipes sp. TaxID=538949 RepID=UPI0025DAF5D7|nr:permease-like cell division protein FtsX [uncultured Alistipes sp.]
MKDDKRLKRKVRNSYIVSTVSIMLVLFLLGSVGYLMVAAMKVADTLQESIAVTVELKNGLSDEQKEAINKRLTAEEVVATIAYQAKEEKIEDAEFRKMFESSEFEEILGENPLLDSFELTLTAASADKELIDTFIGGISKIDGVDRVSYPALMAERLHATVGKIRLVLLLFGGALLIISLILLSNTIRLAIFSKRYLINTMKLVGATKWFIMKPFLGSSVTQGILAGLGASVLFGLAVYGLNEAIPELMTIAEAGKIAIILGAMILGGVVISGLFTIFALNKFVNMKSNKIYLY